MARYIQVITIPVLVSLILIIAEGIIAKEITTVSSSHSNSTRSRAPQHHHKNHRQNNTRRNETLLGLADGDRETFNNFNLTEKEKYDSTYEDSDDYTYVDDSGDNEVATVDDDNKFIETDSSGIISDHVDFVLLRLKHISMRTSSNITELLALQEEEFEVNQPYKLGWLSAAEVYNSTKRQKIFANTSSDSIVRKVPEEYHIAVIAYTLNTLYSEFNKDTREVCSGTDIDHFKWKSYFKLLQLAIETLGTQEERWKDNIRFLYRGASVEYVLKEDQIIAFQHFVSTSAALTTAENFAGKSLFEFEGFYKGTAMAIWDHSYYEQEKEVLFSPLQVFRVDSIHVGSHYTRYVLVKHVMPSPCDQQTTTATGDHRQDPLSSVSSSVIHGNSVLVITFLISCIKIIY